MKKTTIMMLALVVLAAAFCTSSRKAAATKPEPITYAATIQPIMAARCTPCHMPGGNKKQYNTYASVKGDVDDIISRIQRNPGERGYMPMRHPKLGADTIALFVQWKAEGLLEAKL